jgi:cytochrome d ubiquinol oxidase subunit I
VGRQPWIAWQVMRTTDAVTSAHGLPFAYASLALVYIGLTVVAVWLLRRVAREEPGRMPSVPASVEAR